MAEKKKKIEDRYKKLDHRNHILKRPTMYIGSNITEKIQMYVIEDLSNLKFVKKEIDYNPAFCNIFGEILVNASDHYIRTGGEVKTIKINVDHESISVENDGPGIPIEMHPVEKVYVPELLFSDLLTGENYDDEEERVVGGMNGLGAKLTNIYSKLFTIECADGKKKFNQTFTNNLSEKTKPKIADCKKSYTKITYVPDFEKFGLIEINDEIQQIFLKRAVDIAMYCPKVKVYYNDVLIPVKSMKDYISMYIDSYDIITEKINDNWEIGVTKPETDQFEQISMVNGIFTYNGGTHVNYITNKIVKVITEQLQKKYKDSKISEVDIKRNLFVFVNSKIVNPVFDTQTKEKLSTSATKFKDVELSDTFIKKLMNSNIITSIIEYIESKEAIKLKNASGGKKSKVKVKKLIDANKAGTNESEKCYIGLTEGDSATTFVLSGIEKKDKDYFGIFPLKGKPLNVRDVSQKKILENEEIMNIINILGLEFGKKYTSTKELRYGKLIIFSDMDVDGIHIKGLLINLFDKFWPELLELNFLYEFITPIVRATKGNDKKYFYKLSDYKTFKQSDESKGYFIKYYKGLGTIDSAESKLFFKRINKHLIPIYNSENRDIIDMLFKTKRSDERKEWLLTYKPDLIVDKFSEKTTIDSFFNNEFIEFSMYDNIRSIPSIVDGLKPSQRKVLYTMFNKNFKNEIKVSQLTGSIIDVAAYHHGPQSLEQTIINMAQDFIATNNINLLMPNGGFGSRLFGGSDSAAPRYIFTELNKITRDIFKKEDDDILTYLDDDGKLIEPKYYVPIIPMILINGTKGIGTGYATDIPQFNPKDIVKWYINKLEGKENRKKLEPYYKNFKGTIEYIEEKDSWVSYGVYSRNDKSIHITELPIGVWNEKYIEHLDKLVENKIIKDYSNNCTDTEVDFTLKVDSNIEVDLKLQSDIKQNLMAFDENGILRRYESVYDILENFYNIRYDFYIKRKDMLIQKKNYERDIIKYRGMFIESIVNNKLNINNKSKDVIEIELEKLNILKMDDSYSYLLNMSISSLTKEKLIELKEQFKKVKEELKELKEITIEDMWLNDLKKLKL